MVKIKYRSIPVVFFIVAISSFAIFNDCNYNEARDEENHIKSQIDSCVIYNIQLTDSLLRVTNNNVDSIQNKLEVVNSGLDDGNKRLDSLQQECKRSTRRILKSINKD